MAESALALNEEEQLLVLVADAVMQGGICGEELRGKVAPLISGAFDWQRFMRLAQYHYYLAAAARSFKDAEVLTDIPRQVQEVLESEYVLSQARFLKKESELRLIVKEMEKRGIDPVVMKGVPLAYLLYRDQGVRALKDIDILVRPSDMELAQRLLQEQGYSIYTGLHSQEEYSKYHFHHVFVRGDNLDSVIELHWGVIQPMSTHCRIDRDSLAEGTIQVLVGDMTMRTLSLAHALWHTSLNAAQSSFLSFRNLVEMRGIARRLKGSDWDTVLAWSSRCNTNRELKLALNLCESLDGSVFDAIVKRRLKPDFAMRNFVLTRFYPRALVWEWVPFFATHDVVMRLYLRRGLSRKLQYLYRLVFPDRATLFDHYFDYREGSVHTRIRTHLNGLYVLLKVGFLTFAMGMLVRSGILGAGRLDPEKHKRSQYAYKTAAGL